MAGFFRFNSTLNAALAIGVGGLLSRLLGLLRDRLLASNFGASRELDIYYVAFRIPDFIYGILILGAISAAFIPIFVSLESEKEKNEFSSSALNIIVILMGLVSFLLFLFTPFVISFIAPGFGKENQAITVLLTRIMLLQPIILALSNVITSILQGFKKFFLTALAPLFYNLGIIIGIIFFTPSLGIKGLAYGVVLGALLHLAIQLPGFASISFSWQPIFVFTKSIKKLFTLMGPRVFGIASDQVNLIAITAIASTLSFGSIAIFNLAQNIQSAPIGIIGIAIATAVFPALSSVLRKKEGAKEEFIHTFSEAFRLILFFSIPLSILFILLRAQIVRVVLGAGLFNWEHTRLTAAVLGIFGLSVFAQSLIPLLTRSFYSMKDTKTPVLVGVSGVFINIGLALALLKFLSQNAPLTRLLGNALKLQGIPDIRIIALPLAFSFTMLLEFILLFSLLFWRLDSKEAKPINNSWLKLVGATLIMAIITYLSLRPLSHLFDMTTGIGLLGQGLGAGIIGLAVYFLITAFLRENPFMAKSK